MSPRSRTSTLARVPIDFCPWGAYLPAMAKHSKSSAPSQRMLRVGELVRHEISSLLQRGEVMDDVFDFSTITVPEVRMTPDLRLAKVYVMPLGGENAPEIADALNHHARFIRKMVVPKLDLKYAPEFRFLVDETFDEYGRIDALLRSDKVRQDLRDPDSDDA